MKDIFEKFLSNGEANENDTRILNAHKSFFTSEEGRIVLDQILHDMKFLQECKTEGDMALNNYAKKLLIRIFWDSKKEAVSGRRIINLVKRLIGAKKCL